MKSLILPCLEWMGKQHAVPAWLLVCHCKTHEVQPSAIIHDAGGVVVVLLFLSEGALTISFMNEQVPSGCQSCLLCFNFTECQC